MNYIDFYLKTQCFNFVIDLVSGTYCLNDKYVTFRGIKSEKIMIKKEKNNLMPIIIDYNTIIDIDFKKAITTEYPIPKFEHSFTKQTIIWALGCLLFKAFINKLSFGSRNKWITYVREILNTKLTPLGILTKQIPKPLRKIIIKSLKKDSLFRHKSVDKMSFDLNKKSPIFTLINTSLTYLLKIKNVISVNVIV